MEENNGAIKYGLVALVIVGAFVLGFGLLFKTGDVAAKAQAGFVSEQRQVMREAMSMAREARDMQRQQQREMQEAMMESYEGYEYGEYSGNQTYGSDEYEYSDER